MTADINEVVANIRSGDKIGILVYLHHGGDVHARNSMGWTLLHIACFEGKTEIVEILLDNGAQVNSCTTDMRTPLHRASAQGCKGAVAALLGKNAYVNAQDKNGDTALHEAARGAHTSIVKALINSKADKGRLNMRQQTFLDLVGQQVMPLVESGDTESLTLWLDWGLSPDTCGSIGWSLLHHAAARGQTDLAKMLIKRGASVMLLDGNKSTPLHSAAFHGHKEIAKLLLKEGADPNYQDQRGNTPLHSAVSGSHADIINMLLENQADTSIPNTEGMIFQHIVKDVLVTAVHECKTAQVVALLKGRADPDTRDSDGTPVLCVAAFKKDIMIVDALLESGADPNLSSSDSKKTALHYAAFWEDLYIIRALLDHKAKIDTTDKFGGTPLHEAAREGHVDVITMLTGRLAAVNIADEEGNTPLHVAARAGQTDVVELLLEKGSNESICNKDGLLYSDLALIHAVRTEVADKVMSGLAWGGNPNSKDHRGWALLHHAVYKGSLEITSLLLECEADVNAVDNHGRTPLLLAAYRGNCEIISKLMSEGGTLDSQDWEGQTALHWAAREGSVVAVLLLIDGGADTSVKDKQGRRFTSWLVKHLYLAVRHNDSEKVSQLLSAGADQFTRVDGTDVTPREEAKRRKCYVILRQLAAHAPPAEPYEQPDYWDMPTIEDLRLLFKDRGDDGGSSSDSEDEAEWKMQNADVVLSAKEVFAEDNESLWEVWDEKPKWVTAKELFQEDIQDFWESWEERPKIVSAKEFFKEDEKPWWDENVDQSQESDPNAVDEGESESDSEDSQVTEKIIEVEHDYQYKKSGLVSAKDFFKEDDNWWSDNLESLDQPKAISAKDFFKEDTPWWEADDVDYDGDCNEDDDTTEADNTEEESSSLTSTPFNRKGETVISAKEFFKEDECWWRDAVEDLEAPKVVSAKDFFKEDEAWWEKADEDAAYSSEKAIPAKDFFKVDDAWLEDKDDTDLDASLTDDEAYESIISDTSTMFSASEGVSSDQFQECDWWLSPENSEATSAVIKAKDLFKEEAWWDETSETSEGTDTEVSEGIDIPYQGGSVLKEAAPSSTSDSDSEETQAESIVEEDVESVIDGDSDILDGDRAHFEDNNLEKIYTDQESEPGFKNIMSSCLTTRNREVARDGDVICQDTSDDDSTTSTKTSVDLNLCNDNKRDFVQITRAEKVNDSGQVSPEAAADDDNNNDDADIDDDDETCLPDPSANDSNADSPLEKPDVDSREVAWSAPKPSLLTKPDKKSFQGSKEMSKVETHASNIEYLNAPSNDTEVTEIVVSIPLKRALNISVETPSSERYSIEPSPDDDRIYELDVKMPSIVKRDIFHNNFKIESFEIAINKMDESIARLDARIAEVDSQLCNEGHRPRPANSCAKIPANEIRSSSLSEVDQQKEEEQDGDKTTSNIKRDFNDIIDEVVQNEESGLENEHKSSVIGDETHSPPTKEWGKCLDYDSKISLSSCDDNNVDEDNMQKQKNEIRITENEIHSSEHPCHQATSAKGKFQVFKVNVRMSYNDTVLSTESNDSIELIDSSSSNTPVTFKENKEQSKIFDELVYNLLTEDTNPSQAENNSKSTDAEDLADTRDKQAGSKHITDNVTGTSITNESYSINSYISKRNDQLILNEDDKKLNSTTVEANIQEAEPSCDKSDRNALENDLPRERIIARSIEKDSKDKQIEIDNIDLGVESLSDENCYTKISDNIHEVNDIESTVKKDVTTPTTEITADTADNILHTNSAEYTQGGKSEEVDCEDDSGLNDHPSKDCEDESELNEHPLKDCEDESGLNDHPSKDKIESQSESESDEQTDCRRVCISREQSIENEILDPSPPPVKINMDIWRCSTYEPITISEFDHMVFLIGRSASFHGDLRTNRTSDSEVRISRESLLNEPYSHPSEGITKIDETEHAETNRARARSPREQALNSDIGGDQTNESQSKLVHEERTKSDPESETSPPCTSSVNVSPPVTPMRSKDFRRGPLPSGKKPTPIVAKCFVCSTEMSHEKLKCDSGEGNVVISSSVPKTSVSTASSVSPPVGPPSPTTIVNARPAASGAVNQSRPQPRRPDNVRKSSSCTLT